MAKLINFTAIFIITILTATAFPNNWNQLPFRPQAQQPVQPYQTQASQFQPYQMQASQFQPYQGQTQPQTYPIQNQRQMYHTPLYGQPSQQYGMQSPQYQVQTPSPFFLGGFIDIENGPKRVKLGGDLGSFLNQFSQFGKPRQR